MTKLTLVKKIAVETGLPQLQAESVVSQVFDHIRKEVESAGKFSLVGFGTLWVNSLKARVGRNPRTGALVNIPGRGAVRFRASAAIKKAAQSFQERSGEKA
jgi:DNA-binding protein HU-beta